MIGRAKRMVAQNFDNAAIGDLAACTLHDHSFKFGLQRCQSRKAAFNLCQLSLRDGIGSSAGLIRSVRQAQQVADRFEREAQIAGVPDEGQTLHRFAAVESLVARAALGFGKQADLLVIADRRYLHPGGLAQLSDSQHQIPLEAIVARDIRLLIR
jgi:hypothetical protein